AANESSWPHQSAISKQSIQKPQLHAHSTSSSSDSSSSTSSSSVSPYVATTTCFSLLFFFPSSFLSSLSTTLPLSSPNGDSPLRTPALNTPLLLFSFFFLLLILIAF
ncbi:hypothetical protein PFISCL1PPCAC_11969, partial [Pristionchus fissidentatus]